MADYLAILKTLAKVASKGIIQKQKAHFARARTRLQNEASPTISPFHSSFFRHDPPFSLRTVRHTGHSRTLQSHENGMGVSPVLHSALETHDVAEEKSLQAAKDTAASGVTNSEYAT